MDYQSLRECTVRLKAGSQIGTGFFVDDGTVLTCAHVVRDVGLDGLVNVGKSDAGKVVRFEPERDLALLKVTATGRVALLGDYFQLNDPLYSYGYPKSSPQGDPVTAKVIALDGLGLIKFKDADVEPGMSGAPVLNTQTQKVCGMVKASYDRVGGYAIPGDLLRAFCLEPPDPSDLLGGLPGELRADIEAFFVQYVGTPEYPAPFGGRQSDLAVLDEWLQKADSPRYGLVTARGGVGKSALLCHWVESLNAHGTAHALIYHPISARRETNSATAVFQSLAFRLAAIFREPAPDTQDLETLRRTVRQYIAAANRANRPLLIVLDGLDEAAGWDPNEKLFPPSRQGSVRVLVAARPMEAQGHRDWLNRLGWQPAGVARRFDLGSLDKGGVADVLRRMGDPLRPLSSRIDVIEALFRKSQGDPLVVGLYVEKLREYVERPDEFAIAEFEKVEPGLAGFFENWFEDQFKLWGDERRRREPRVRTLLGLCALAHGPLTGEDVRALTPEEFASELEADDAARELWRFLIRGGRQSGYVFGHPRFGDYVRDEMLGEERRAELRRRFVVYGAHAVEELMALRRERAPTYVVRWYATHLQEMRRPLDEFRPLLSERWSQECERVDGTPARFLADLDLAWAAAAGPGGVGARMRIALLRSSLLTVGRRIPVELFARCIEAGIFSPTLAEVIARQQKEDQWRYLMELARLAPAEKDRLLEAATEAARTLDEDERATGLCEIAQRLSGPARANLVKEAESVAWRQDFDQWRVESFCQVASLLEAGERQRTLGEALESLRRAGDDNFAYGVSRMSEFLREDDRELLKAALAIAASVGQEGSRAWAVRELTARIGEADRELLSLVADAGRPMVSPNSRCAVLGSLAFRAEPSGWQEQIFQDALDAARRIEDKRYCAQGLCQLGARAKSPRMDLFEEGLDMARQLASPQDSAETLIEAADLVQEDYRQAILREALKAARRIEEPSKQITAMVAAGSRMAGPERRDALLDSLNIACGIEEDWDQASNLGTVARSLAEGDGELLDAVLAAAVRVGAGSRIPVLTELALRIPIADRERIDRVLAAVREIGDVDERGSTLLALASVVDETELEPMFPRILEGAEASDPSDLVETLAGLAIRLSGNLRAAAIRTAEASMHRVRDAYLRAACRMALAPVADDGETALRQALDAIESITEEDACARALEMFAPKLAGWDKGLLERTLEVAGAIGDERQRVVAMVAVTRTLGAHQALVEVALHLALRLQVGLFLAYALNTIVTIDETRRAELAPKALAAARGDANPHYQALGLCHAALCFLGEERRTILREAREAARRIQGPNEHASALVEVAERMESEEEKSDVLREALEIGETIEREDLRVQLWVQIASNRMGEARSALLRKVLQTAAAIDEDDDPAFVLTDAVAAMEATDRQLLDDAWERGRRFHRLDFRAQVISSVAQKLSGEELQRRSRDVRTLIGEDDALGYLRAIGKDWPDFIKASRKPAWDELGSWLGPLSREERPHLLKAIAVLAPAIADAGEAGAVRETVDAILDVGLGWQ